MLEAVGSRADEQVRRGLPGQALLRRLRGRGRDRAARDRPREGAVRRRARERPAARGRADEHGRLLGARCEPGRHDPLARASTTAATSRTGSRSTSPGRLYTIVHYGVSRETNVVDYDEVLALAKEHRPKLIVCGGSAYPRTVETDRFREIADEVGALLLCDMAHFAGLVAAGLHPNPVAHCDFVTSTTHKTLAGPRAGFVLCREEHAQAVDRAVFPGHAGRAARARDRGQGDLLPDRGDRGVPRVPDAGARERRRARRRRCRTAGSTSSPAAPTRTCCRSTCARTEWTGKDAEERLARGEASR